MTKEQEKFIKKIAAYVKQYAPEYGIRVYSPIIAQAILESAWGKSKLAAQYKNYFGLKAGTKWTGPAVNLTTAEEYEPGTKTVIKDYFRVYPNMEEGVKGYFEFLQLPRYQNLRGVTDPAEYLEKIKADGYATSSTYVKDLMSVIRHYNLTQYDPEQAEPAGEYKAGFKSEEAAIDALLATAEAEEGYLEKKTNANLDSKTANAGSGNYTKYWRDVKPGFQGQYWCACFVSWCFMVVFGQEMARKLLKHWPFVYCPALAAKTTNKTPERGAVILFWKPTLGRYGHTGLVYKVTATHVYTIEGNTSGGSGVISNGGGVVKKKYKRAALHDKTLFFMPDYSLVTAPEKPAEAKKEAKTEKDTAPAKSSSGRLLKGYEGTFPSLDNGRGWYEKGDGITTLKNYKTQIKRIQRLVNWINTGDAARGLAIDGEYGAKTAAGVRFAQIVLRAAVDGKFGKETLAEAKKYKR